MNNLRNLALWIVIALLLVLLFNLFQGTGTHGNAQRQSPTPSSTRRWFRATSSGHHPGQTRSRATLTNGQPFTTYAPDDPQSRVAHARPQCGDHSAARR